MARRLSPLPPDEFTAICERLDAGTATRDDEKAAVKHVLALLQAKAPGRSVEVRVAPYAAIQCVGGTSHTRGTPPAVVEMDAVTLIALARGVLTWDNAKITASGQRSDLSPHFPLA